MISPDRVIVDWIIGAKLVHIFHRQISLDLSYRKRPRSPKMTDGIIRSQCEAVEKLAAAPNQKVELPSRTIAAARI